jgi:hypothetical protein
MRPMEPVNDATPVVPAENARFGCESPGEPEADAQPGVEGGDDAAPEEAGYGYGV